MADTDKAKEAALIAKTAALESLIEGVNPLTDDPIAFLDKIEAIIGTEG
jgi:hypothetical protein